MKQPELTTSRLLLRKFLPDDASRVALLAGDHDVAKNTMNIPHPYSLAMANGWIQSQAANAKQDLKLVYAIVLKNQGMVIGAISFNEVQLNESNESTATLGYWIGKPYWGRGYCSEAATEMIKLALQRLELDSVAAQHLVSNPASGKVMQHAGMRYVMTKPQPGRDGRIVDMAHYAISRHDV